MKPIFRYLFILSASVMALAACGTQTAMPTIAPTTAPTLAPTALPTIMQNTPTPALTTSKTESNRAAAIDAFSRMFSGDASAVDQYFAKDFINHNPFGGGQGVDSYRQLSKQLGGLGFPMWKPLRSVASGDFVAVQGLYQFESVSTFKPNPKTLGVVAMDLFRFDNGKIVEHWDALQDVVPPEKTPDKNDMLGGATGKPGAPAFDPKTMQSIVVAFGKGDASPIKANFSEKYINHNTYGGDGWDGLDQLVGAFAKSGFQMYTPVRAIADGDMVLLHGIFHFENLESFKPSASAPGVIAFDLFRVENGKIVEHWDVLQNNIPSDKTSGGISTTGDGLSK